VTSSNAVLTVASSPVILIQPTNQTVGMGVIVTNVVIAIGTGPLNYQWWVNGTNKLVNGTNLVNGLSVITSGATNYVLTIKNAQTDQQRQLHGHHHEPGRVGDQFQCDLDGDEYPAGDYAATDKPDGGGGFDRDDIALGTGVPAFLFPMAERRDEPGGWTNISGSTISGATNFTLIIINAQTTTAKLLAIHHDRRRNDEQFHCGPRVIVPSPSFGKIVATSDGGFILRGDGGKSNGTYYVLSSSNLLVPLTDWTYIATDHF